jgi:hypothetical protein
MPNHVIVWDIETVPDIRGFAVANGHDSKSDDAIDLCDVLYRHSIRMTEVSYTNFAG